MWMSSMLRKLSFSDAGMYIEAMVVLLCEAIFMKAMDAAMPCLVHEPAPFPLLQRMASQEGSGDPLSRPG